MPLLRLGIAGLGAVSRRIIAALARLPEVELTAGADTQPAAVAAFEAKCGAKGYASVEAMCASGDIDVVWIATPNGFHADHTILAADCGLHVVVEKPMALTLDEADRMIAASERNGVQLVLGHSQTSSPPIRQMREVIGSGRLGRVIQINTWHFNDWLQRPRLPAEIDTARGGGIVYRQGPHQVDTLRYLGGGLVKNIRAVAGRADRHFDTEGHYTAFLEFDDGISATMVYNGYGFFDISELTWGIGELPKRPETDTNKTTASRRRLTGPVDQDFKQSNPYVTDDMAEREGEMQPFAGLTIVSCERGVIRQSPKGIFVYTEAGCEEIPCAFTGGREGTVLRELHQALAQNRPAFPDGRWGKATLEVCVAMLQSTHERREVALKHQVRCS